MAQDNDTRRWIYDSLVNDGYELGSYEEFSNNADDPEIRKWVYENARKSGYDLGTYEQFDKGMGYRRPAQEQEEASGDIYSVQTAKEGDEGSNSVGSGFVGSKRPNLKEMTDEKSFLPMEQASRIHSDDYEFRSGYNLENRLKTAFEKGAFEPFLHKEEDQEIDKQYVARRVESDADILENYRNRFNLTHRGVELQNERSQIPDQITKHYFDIFKESPEYKEITGRRYVSQKEKDEANETLNDLFRLRYGKDISKDMQPYVKAVEREMFNRYGPRINEELKQLNKESTAAQVSELVKGVDLLLDRKHARLKQHGGSGGNAMNALMGSWRYNQSTSSERQEIGMLESAKKLLEQSQNIINEAGKKGNTNFVAGFGRGVKDNFNIDNFTFGLSEMADAKYLKDAIDKFDKGEDLTEAEEALLEASAVNMATQAYFSSDLGRGYGAGQTTAVSLPFMLEFLVNPVSSSGNTIAKGLLKYGMKKFGKAAMKKSASKFAARLTGDAVAALGMELTTGIPRVAAGTLERLNGNYDYSFDDKDSLQMKKTGDISLTGALARAAGNTFFENQSEMIFNAFKGFSPFLKAADNTLPGKVGEFMQRIKDSKVGHLYSELKNNPTFKEAAARAQFHGLPEEYLEEVYNNLANVSMGEMSMEDALSLDNNIDTFLGLAPTTVMFGMLGLGSMATERYNTRKRMQRFERGLDPEHLSSFQELRRLAKERGNEYIKSFIKLTLEDTVSSPQEKRDKIEYAYNLVKQNAIDDIHEMETEDSVRQETENVVDASNRETGNYVEAGRKVWDNDTQEYVIVSGTIVGGDMTDEREYVIWKPEDGGETVMLPKKEIDPASVQMMPVQEVTGAVGEMIRDEAQIQAEREAMFSPEIPEPAIGTSFMDGEGRQIQIVQQNPDGGWIGVSTVLDGKGQPQTDKNGQPVMRTFPVTEEEYYTAMQAQIDAQEATDNREMESIMSEEMLENANTPSTEYNIMSEGTRANNIEKEVEEQKTETRREDDSSKTDIPMDDKGNLLYYRVPVDTTIADLDDGSLTPEEVDGFISANKNEAAKILKRISEKPPKIGTNKARYIADKKEWQNKVADAQAQVDYWNDVESQIKVLRQQPGDAIAEEIKAMGDPVNGEELAAMMLATGKLPLLYSEYKRETGFHNTDAKGMFGLFVSKEKGGMTIEQAGEQLMLADLEADTNFLDQNEPNAGRNAIIDVLSSVRTRGDLINYIKNNREAMAERERQAEADADEMAKEQWFQDNYHMTLEEYELWSKGELFSESNILSDDEIIEFYNTFVDEIFKGEAYDSRRESTNDERNPTGESHEQGRIPQPREGSPDILQGEEPVSAGRVEGYQGEPEKVAGQVDGNLYSANDGLQSGSSTRELISSSRSQENVPEASHVPSRMEGESLLDYAGRVNDAYVLQVEERKVNTSPTEAQKEAGNYKKGHIKIDGFDITIENPKGSERSGVDASGKPWSVTMNNTYGYIRGTEGVDGDHIDVFLGGSGNGVYVVDQLKEDGSFDEHKVMYGFSSLDEAKEAYLSNYSAGWKGLGNITGVSKGVFKEWIDSSHRKTKPFAEYKIVQERAAEGLNETIQDEDDKNIRFREDKTEEQGIIERAKADGTYMKAPNGRPTNLTERQWVQVRTKAFKKWFGDWEKAVRIRKLRNSKPVEITGNEITPDDDLKQYKKNALEYGKALQGEYINKDTLNVIQLQRGRRNGGINEVLQHDYKDAEHLQSIAAIPQIIENSIYVDSYENEDIDKNPNVKEYQYYVCGLKIGNEDYTVRSTIAVDKNGNRYYDHKLTQIEKGKLLDQIDDQAVNNIGFGTTPGTKPTTVNLINQIDLVKAQVYDDKAASLSDFKDKRLLSILQVNSSKVVDENGEPLIVYHGTPDSSFYTFDRKYIGSSTDKGIFGRGFYFTPDKGYASSYTARKGGNGRNIEVYLDIKHPFIISSADAVKVFNSYYMKYVTDDIFEEVEGTEERLAQAYEKGTQDLISAGYDGVIAQFDRVNELVAFSAEQIKSATDNMGEFSSFNADIRFREVKEKDGSRSLVGLHNLSEDKLRKALKLGGFANPSAAVIDIDRQSHEGYGELSLILPSSMIAKSTGRNSGTFSGDAWTPTYPQLERQFGDGGGSRIYDDISKLPEEMQPDVRAAWNSYMDGRDAHALAYQFLYEKGEAPELRKIEPVYSEEIRKKVAEADTLDDYDERNAALLDAYIDEKFEGNRTKFEEYIETRKRSLQKKLDEISSNKGLAYRKTVEKLNDIEEKGYEYNSVRNFYNEVISDIRKSRGVDTYQTVQDALDKISRSEVLSQEYDEWKEKLADRYGIKEVLFKGYTSSGSRVYLPYTLENVSKIMRQQGLAGATGWRGLFSKFAAGLMKSTGTLDGIRRQKGKLTANHDDVDAFRDKWGKVYFDLGAKLNPDADAFDDTGLYRVEEIATKPNPKTFAKHEYGIELSDEDVLQLDEMVDAIRNEYPAMYFETKFERPVYLNEFAAAVVPDNVDKDIMDAMSEAGLRVFTYKAGDETSRSLAVKQASEIKGVRFRDYMRTYHGSGAEFDKFDLSHSGEGEGEGMIGKGVYTTKDKRIAENYADAAGNRQTGGRKHIYEVEIPADNGSNYLDYDKVYNTGEMSEIAGHLHDAGVDVDFDKYFPGRKANGRDLYTVMAWSMPEGMNVNQALNDAGYVGYKYSTRHDLGGKGKRFPKKSYVVFDESNAVIAGHKQIISEIEKVSSALHTPVKIIHSVDELAEGTVRRAIESGRKVKGWYDVRSGEIVVYLPNATGVEDVKATFLHEIVGHKGLRALLGEKAYDEEMTGLYGLLPVEVRKKVADIAISNYGGNVAIAMDEYLAEQAEKDEIPSWWNKVVSAIRQLLRKAGFDVVLSNNDIKYLLWRSRKNLERNNLLDLAEDVMMRKRLRIGESGSEMDDEMSESLIKELTHFADRYNGKPTVILHGKMTDKELNEVGIDSGYGEIVREILNDKKTLAGFVPSLNKIFIFADNINESNIHKMESTLFHENIHGALNDMYGESPRYLVDAFYNSAKHNYKKLDSFLKNNYDSSEVPEEFFVYLLENDMSEGNFERYSKYLKAGELETLDLILKNIGYDKQRERTKGRGYDNSPNTREWEMRDRSSQGIGEEAESSSLQEGSGLRFRTGGNEEEQPSDGTIEAYEAALNKGGMTGFRAREAYQDSMLALKTLQDVILAKDGSKIKSFEDAYRTENRMSSVSTREMEIFAKDYFKPVVEEVGRLMKDRNISYEEVTDYLIAKHGLERNAVLAQRDAAAAADKAVKEEIDSAYKEYQKNHISQGEYNRILEKAHLKRNDIYKEELEKNVGKDYAGLTGLMNARSEENGEDRDFTAFAEGIVSDFESAQDTGELWSRINRATNQSLKKSYESGLMSKERYETSLGRFRYYVPLRGWDETMADEVYEYLEKQRSPVNSVLKNAKGRKSLADDPIATIGNIAESTILQGNRNLMKQNFLNFVINHPSDLAQVRDVWYVKDNTTGEFVLSFPEIAENASPDEIAHAVEEHEETMKHLEKDGLAKRGRNGLDLEYKILPFQKSEHAIIVKRNGKEIVIYINANPRAAQAVNGLTNPDVENNPILKGMARFNRILAANFTTRNPAFVFSNLWRDMIFATSAVSVKENPLYLARFTTNIPVAVATVWRGIRNERGSSEADRYFREFLDNGGETGYAQLTNVDKYKKMIRKDIRYLTKTDYFRMVRNGIELLEDFNRMAEDISRFTTYMTSRQEGKGVLEAIDDAKEITVNFNKKGAGYKSLNKFEKWYSGGNIAAYSAGVMKNLYLFFNAGVQSLANFGRLKKNLKKLGTMVGGFATAGFMMPFINEFLIQLGGDGDDGQDYYGNLSEWTRRNNICLYIPGSHGHFVTIPLPIELRAFYGLGDIAYQETIGRGGKKGSEIAYDALNQLTELLPLNPLGNNGDIVSTVMPDAIKPFWQVVKNEDFTGSPIYRSNSFNETMPEWTKTYKGTSKQLVKLAEWSNELGGGDKYKTSPAISDWNPAIVEHLLQGYFGGMATLFNQTGKTMMASVESAMEGKKSEDLTWRNAPVLSRFINDASDERSAFRKVNEKFYKYLDDYQETEKLLKGYSKEVSQGNLDYLEKLIKLQESKDYVRYSIFRNLNRKIDQIRQLEKKVGEENNEELREQAGRLKKMVVEEMDKVG